MKSAVTSGMFAVCFLWPCFTAVQTKAQAPGRPVAQPAGTIALVDVNYVLKKNARLNAQLKCLHDDAEKAQKGFERELQRLETQSKQLGTLKPGTPEYEKLEEMLVGMKSRIQSQVILNRKSFVQREARFYCFAYRELADEVSYFCQTQGISLVLNFDGNKIDEHTPDDIARGISNKVVFYAPFLDLTPFFLRDSLSRVKPAPANPPSTLVPSPGPR